MRVELNQEQEFLMNTDYDKFVFPVTFPKSKDLRLGNYIGYFHEESHSIISVDLRDLELIEQYETDPDDDQFSRGLDYGELPLTEDWLKALGFKPYLESEYYINFIGPKKTYISKAKKDIDYGWLDRQGYFYLGESHFKITTVHKLQNYFYEVYNIDLKLDE